jgi:membrane protein
MVLARAWHASGAAVKEFIEDDAMTLAAALAFYTALSLAPLLLIAVWGASLIWGRGAQDEAAARAAQVVGPQGAEIIRTVLGNASQPAQSRFAAILGFGLLLSSASGVFAQLQYSLNRVWDVRARSGMPLTAWLYKRLWTLVMLLVIGAIFLASIIASAVLAGLRGSLSGLHLGWLWGGLNTALPLVLFTLLFAMIYKILPDARTQWRHVWLGAIITTILFMVGRYLIGWYLGRGTISSVYGAAGSLVVLLSWLYYSAVIFFLGAELTQCYARQCGNGGEPAEDAGGPRNKLKLQAQPGDAAGV